jgi:hypothetical protein
MLSIGETFVMVYFLTLLDCNVMILGNYVIAQISVVVFFRVAYHEPQLLRSKLCFEKSATWFFCLHPHPPINAILQFADDVENCSGQKTYYIQIQQGVSCWISSAL